MSYVRDFYNNFTYPFFGVKDRENNMQGEALFSFLNYELNAKRFRGKKFLDAGCGTGHRTLDIAKSFPLAHLTGIDFSMNSIKLARDQARINQINNIQFEFGELEGYDTDQLFDFILFYGVIHHLINPTIVIHNFSRLLNKDGLLICWIYHTYGEFDRMLKRDLLLTLLSDKSGEYEESVILMKEMGYTISKHRYGKSYGEELSENDSLNKDADAFLNPYVKTYSFLEAMSLFKTANLDWVAIEQINYNNRGYFISLKEKEKNPFWVIDGKTILESRKGYEYYKNLSNIEKLRCIELLTRPTGFTILAGNKDSIPKVSQRTRENMILLESIK